MESLRQSTHTRLTVADEADAGAVRRTVARHADRMGANPARRARAELAATELATNLVRHASHGGWMLVRPVRPAAIELIAVDRGPGIRDLDAVLHGHPAHPSGLGCGLAAVRRSSTYFDVHTEPGLGTTVLAVVDLQEQHDAPATPRCWAGVSVAIAGACGDGWAATDLAPGTAIAVVDGLGHGVHASVATDAALTAFAADPTDLPGFVYRANAGMRATRGAAVALCHLEPHLGVLRYVAVGNINGRVIAGSEHRSLVSHSGTLGLRATPPRGQVICTPWPAGATLALWTDGLQSRLDLANRTALFDHDPAIAAAALHRDYSRDRDDATVVVVRNVERP